MKQLILCIVMFSIGYLGIAQPRPATTSNILPGAFQTSEYLPQLKGKRIGVFANQTSMINKTHLVDSLKKLSVNITKIFGPEHGFRGTADAGENVSTYTDEQTGITVVSLYGAKSKPTPQDLADVDLLLFDIQDVGVRFYTYISSLQNFIESAIQNSKPLIILDRPNPNGFYVDGPVLEPDFKSFIGMQPIPVVYGMTIGEYAKMLIGEQWLDWKYIRRQDKRITLGEALGFEEEKSNFKLTVIRCKNYSHSKKYSLPVQPSPNLAEMGSVYWYPSTCFFEGTVLSEGRGTQHPFQIFGHPSLPSTLYAFTPQSTAGVKEPKLKNTLCYGWNLFDAKESYPTQIELGWLLNAYKQFPAKDSFFIRPKSARTLDYFFNKLAGNSTLMKQIMDGKSEAEIRESWQPALEAFKKIRKKYLIYD